WGQHKSIKHLIIVIDQLPYISSIESIIGSSSYSHSKVQQWTSSVIEQCLSQLTKLGKPFKYIVTCVIMQKSGAGLHTASSCYWDSSTDGKRSAFVYHLPAYFRVCLVYIIG
ncbi:unnamed protein product, partial [Schistosoma curassoni]|uniref:Dynein light chain n=1 Tax=Schistosoma curassoni TaxID=6186 RepID=A0A183JGF5_9TREM